MSRLDDYNYWSDSRVISQLAKIDDMFGLQVVNGNVYPYVEDSYSEIMDGDVLAFYKSNGVIKRGLIWNISVETARSEGFQLFGLFGDKEDFLEYLNSGEWETDENHIIGELGQKMFDVPWNDDFFNAHRIHIRFKNIVCPMCDGGGTIVNPSIDAGGLSPEDFDEDPDFEYHYRRGTFDQTCPQCCGRNVVSVKDWSQWNYIQNIDPDKITLTWQVMNWAKQYIDDYVQGRWDMANEIAMERRYGL